MVGSPCCPRDSQESSPTPQFKSINSSVLSFLCTPILISIHDYWTNHSFDYTDIYQLGFLLLLLSRFSRVRLCATPQTAAQQAPQSLGFSRQKHWSGLPFPSPMHESEKRSEVAQSCPTLSDPMDCSLPGSSVHGVFQARVLEWGTSLMIAW